MIFRAIILCLSLLASSVVVMPQENISTSRKFDAFGDLPADDAMAHLDNFALALSQSPNSTGYIVGYNEQQFLPGRFLRRLYGYWDYLVNMRGINANRIKVLAGGYRNDSIVELWLVPNDEPPPKLSSEMQVNLTSPIKFDSVLMGVGCEPEFTVDLYELNAGLQFYANVLRENTKSRAWIIIYPSRRGRMSKAAGIARRTKNLLVRDFNIAGDRIITRISNRRQACMKAEIWIAPAGAVPTTATSNNSFNASANSGAFIRETMLLSRLVAPH
jgi:hypothetical protein